MCYLQNTERRYEQTFANARTTGSSAGAGGTSVDTQGLRRDAHGNIIQVQSLSARALKVDGFPLPNKVIFGSACLNPATCCDLRASLFAGASLNV